MLTVAKISPSQSIHNQKLDSWEHLTSNLFETKHLWNIDNFSFRQENEITSSVFKLALPDKEIELVILVHPRYSYAKIENRIQKTYTYVSTFVKVVTEDVSLNCKVKLGLITKDGSINLLHKPDGSITLKTNLLAGSRLFIKRSDLLDKENANYLHSDQLNVYCEFSAVCEATIEKSMNFKSKFIGRTVSEDIQELFETKNYSDFELVVDGRTIKVHKSILAARSSVFAALLPDATSTMDINGLSYDVVEEFLRFIYTGQVKNIDSISKELLLASIKYEMSGLKTLCCKNIVSKLDVVNAADFLKFTHEEDLEDLKDVALNYFKKHIKAIMNTDGFQTLKTMYPKLVMEYLIDALSL